MSLSIGIVGLPNVGKSSLFNLLTKKGVEAANYPFCTIDPNVGVVKVPDHRLDELAKISKPKLILPTAIEFVDIAGLVSGAHKGEGLGNKFLAHIRECDAILEVIRSFSDKNITHVSGVIDPKADQETIAMELIFADLATVEKRLEKLRREAKSGDKAINIQIALLERVLGTLNQGKPVRDLEFNKEELVFIKTLNLLSIKPILRLLNIDDNYSNTSEIDANDYLQINVRLEEEIVRLDEAEQLEFIQELGLKQSGLDRLIQSAYKLLDLDTFFTTGQEETRAWTIKSGTKAPQAAAEIHTDFEKGFIRAEVINWKTLVKFGSEQKARESGQIRTEGRDYIIKDGDVCHFLVST